MHTLNGPKLSLVVLFNVFALYVVMYSFAAGAQQLPQMSPEQLQILLGSRPSQQLQGQVRTQQFDQEKSQALEPERNSRTYPSYQEPIYRPGQQVVPFFSEEEETFRIEGRPTITLSPVESDYLSRFDVKLRQFGYRLFAGDSSGQPTIGSIENDYVVGRGDRLYISLRGQLNTSYTVDVDSEGRIILPDLDPIFISGSTLGDVKQLINDKINEEYLETKAYVSLGSIRSITVLVTGEVARPGRQRVSALSSLLDAVIAAGGIERTGTLRNVELRRNGQVFPVDLYDLLLGSGSSYRKRLQEGDVIRVPPLGPTVAVSGKIKRPAIYELKQGATGMRLRTLLAISGGTLRPRGNVYELWKTDNAGHQIAEEVQNTNILVTDGQLLKVSPRADVTTNIVTLTGHVHREISRPIASAPTVGQLLKDSALLARDPYPLLGVILRNAGPSRIPTRIPFNLAAALAGGQGPRLQGGDQVIVFSQEDIYFLNEPVVQGVLQDPDFALRAQQQCPALRLAANLGKSSGFLKFLGSAIPGKLDSAQAAEKQRTFDGERPMGANLPADVSQGRPDNSAPSINHQVQCPDIFQEYPRIFTYLLEQSAILMEGVQNPGVYPLSKGTGLGTAIQVAGGLRRGVDLGNVELSREVVQNRMNRVKRERLQLADRHFNRVRLNPGDVVRFNMMYSDRSQGFITLSGQFVRPGRYSISRGETLLDVIRRAGGITPQAYPYGAVFTRQSIKEQTQQGFERTAREMQTALVTLASAGGNNGLTGEAALGLRELIGTLRETEAPGRMVVEADPAALAVQPHKNILLERGDALYMPKRPSTVTVSGAVLNPSSLPFESGTGPRSYIMKAGGFQRFADKERVFLVLPDGQARPVQISSWNYRPMQIPPGSTVVVPLNMQPYRGWTITKDLTSIFSNLAVSLASINAISN